MHLKKQINDCQLCRSAVSQAARDEKAQLELLERQLSAPRGTEPDSRCCLQQRQNSAGRTVMQERTQ